MEHRTQGAATSSVPKAAGLMILRITVGFLMIWWGLAKVANAGLGVMISDFFYGGAFSEEGLVLMFGWAQLALGVLVVIGLLRIATLPLLFVVAGYSAFNVWYAIIDPFNLYLGNERGFEFTHLFYPSAVVLGAALVIWLFRDDDRFAVDHMIFRG